MRKLIRSLIPILLPRVIAWLRNRRAGRPRPRSY